MVDPRRTGPAKKADVWLQVRPGTDAALALGIADVMIDRGWYDREFIRDWTNGPLLVREDNGHFLKQKDLDTNGSAKKYAALDESGGGLTFIDPETGRYEGENSYPGAVWRFQD